MQYITIVKHINILTCIKIVAIKLGIYVLIKLNNNLNLPNSIPCVKYIPKVVELTAIINFIIFELLILLSNMYLTICTMLKVGIMIDK